MRTRNDLIPPLLEALKALGGSTTIVSVSEYIWKNYEEDLRKSGDLFYTWHYDLRWAARTLRERKALKSASISPKGIWELA